MSSLSSTSTTPPAVLRAELRLLNAIYKNPDFIVSESLNEDLLPAYTAKVVFNAICNLVRDEIPLSFNSLIEKVHSIDGDITVGLVQSIIDLEEEALTTIKDIKEDLLHERNKTTAIEYLKIFQQKIGSKFRLSVEQEKELRSDLYEAEKLLFSIDESLPVQNMEQWFNQYMIEFDKRRSGKLWKFYDAMLDFLITEGPSPGSFGLLVAATGMGKSSFLLNLINKFIN
jgi:replicative DNA helicase